MSSANKQHKYLWFFSYASSRFVVNSKQSGLYNETGRIITLWLSRQSNKWQLVDFISNCETTIFLAAVFCLLGFRHKWAGFFPLRARGGEDDCFGNETFHLILMVDSHFLIEQLYFSLPFEANSKATLTCQASLPPQSCLHSVSLIQLPQRAPP